MSERERKRERGGERKKEGLRETQRVCVFLLPSVMCTNVHNHTKI